MFPGTTPPYYEYTIRPSDTLSQLIFTFYGFVSSSPNYQGAKEHLLSLNPEIKNPDRIQVGQILRVAEYPPPSIFAGPNRPPHLLRSLQDPPLRGHLGQSEFHHEPGPPLGPRHILGIVLARTSWPLAYGPGRYRPGGNF